jgi:hypothetical protein
VAFIASSDEEARTCARARYGDAVIDEPLEAVSLSVTCSHSGCMDRTYYARDDDAAKSCAEASSPGCTVDDEPCP